MPRAKTYKQKEREIQQYYKQKRYDLKRSIELKHGKKIDSEYNRRVKTLDRSEENKLHNLKIKMGEARGNAKIRKRKVVRRPYSDCYKLLQLYAKLIHSDEYGYGECICCPGTKVIRHKGQGGHFIPKGVSRYLALQIDNISFQHEDCNHKPGGNQALQRPQMIKKVGLERVEEMERQSKDAIHYKAEQIIGEYLPKALAELEKKIRLPGKKKKCMKQSYYKNISVLQGKYM